MSIIVCEPDNHNFKIEPMQTVTKGAPGTEINTVTVFLQHCTKCGHTNEICKPEDYQFISED